MAAKDAEGKDLVAVSIIPGYWKNPNGSYRTGLALQINGNSAAAVALSLPHVDDLIFELIKARDIMEREDGI